MSPDTCQQISGYFLCVWIFFFLISWNTNLSQIAKDGHGLSIFKPVCAAAHLINLQCCCSLVLYFRPLHSVLNVAAHKMGQITLAGCFAGKKSISSHLFPFLSVTHLWHSDPAYQAQRNRRNCCATLGMWVVSVPGHQGKEGQPKAFSLACAWTGEAPYDLWKGTHTPAIWPGTRHRETSGLLFSPGLHLSLDFPLN